MMTVGAAMFCVAFRWGKQVLLPVGYADCHACNAGWVSFYCLQKSMPNLCRWIFPLQPFAIWKHFKIKMTMPVRMNFDSSIMKCVGGRTQSADIERKLNSTSSPARCGIGPRTFSTSSNSVHSNSWVVGIIPSGACNINTQGFSPSVVTYT